MAFVMGNLSKIHNVVPVVVTTMVSNENPTEVLQTEDSTHSRCLPTIKWGVLKDKITNILPKKKDTPAEGEPLISGVDRIHRYSSLKKVFIFGADYGDSNALRDFTLGLLRGKMGINLSSADIYNVYWVGEYCERGHIVVEFVRYGHKRLVLYRRRFLRGTGVTIRGDMRMSRAALMRTSLLQMDAQEAWITPATYWDKAGSPQVVKKPLDDYLLYVNMRNRLSLMSFLLECYLSPVAFLRIVNLLLEFHVDL